MPRDRRLEVAAAILLILLLQVILFLIGVLIAT